MPDAPPPNPAIEPFQFLLGAWRGKGNGHYPGIEDFTYLEVATFSHVGKPFIAYNQRTQHAVTGQPLHAEAGYLRPTGDETAEFVVVQPSGIIEMHDVARNGTALEMTSTSVATTPTAKRADAVTRSLAVDGDVLRYRLDMAAMGHPLQEHLVAELGRG